MNNDFCRFGGQSTPSVLYCLHIAYATLFSISRTQSYNIDIPRSCPDLTAEFENGLTSQYTWEDMALYLYYVMKNLLTLLLMALVSIVNRKLGN